MYPKLREGAIMRRRLDCEYPSEADCVALNPSGEVYLLTPEFYEIMSSCNGTTLSQDVPGFVDFIDKNPECLEIISLETLSGKIPQRQVVETCGLVVPCRQAIWHLTKRCNMKCSHCYYLAGGSTGKQTFSDEEIVSISSNLSELGVESVRLSGGEISLDCPQLELVVNELTRQNCIPVILNTNGWKQQDTVAKMLQNNPFVRGVQISLDGTKISHNSLRGVESYDEVVLSIERYLEAGIHVRVISMLTDQWLAKNDVEKVCERIAELGIRDWVVEIPSTVGRWSNDLTSRVAEIAVSARAFYSFLENSRHSLGYFSLAQVFNWPLSLARETKTLGDSICSHDLGLITFGPEGVSYCTLFQQQFGERLACLGHLYTDQHKKIWNTIARTRLTHTIAENLSCSSCDLFPICQGGCPGQYTNPKEFQGCDVHSRNLALVGRQFFADLGVINQNGKEV